MKDKKIDNRIHGLADKIYGFNKKINNRFNKNDIHRLRANFKKLRGLLRWQGKEKKLYGPFDEIYKQAGELRNLQVVLEKTNEQRLPKFKTWLISRLEKAKHVWCANFNKSINDQFLKNINHIKFSFKKKRRFFNVQTNKINSILNYDFISADNIHTIRKRIKDIVFAMGEMPKDNINKAVFKELKTLSEAMGLFIDKRINIQLLKEFKSTVQSAIVLEQTIKAQHQLEDEIKKKKNSLLKKSFTLFAQNPSYFR